MKKTIIIDELYTKVQQKEITVISAVAKIAVFIQTDYRLFSLGKYDEDIRASVVLEFIRTGYKTFDRYDESYGTFHNYVISYVKGICQTTVKKAALKLKREKVEFSQSVDNYQEEEDKHNFILKLERDCLAPYALNNPKRISAEPPLSLLEFMHKKTHNSDAKCTIVVALKACTDLGDSEILKICHENNISEKDFYETVQELKESLDLKYERREKYILSRNAAYSNHRLYDPDIAFPSEKTASIQKLNNQRYENSTALWKRKNHELRRGRFHYSPTNKTIAKKLGICERQVHYYLSRIKEQFPDYIEINDEEEN